MSPKPPTSRSRRIARRLAFVPIVASLMLAGLPATGQAHHTTHGKLHAAGGKPAGTGSGHKVR